MPSFTNQLNGEILMVMDSVTKKMETKQMPAQQYEEHQFLIVLDVEILMEMVGRIQQMDGRHIHTVLQIHSQRRHFSGEILTQMDLGTSLLVLCEMIAQKRSGPRLETSKDVRIRMTMAGQMNMVNGTLLLLSWAKTQLLLG
jgi:hypothetical protein